MPLRELRSGWSLLLLPYDLEALVKTFGSEE